MEENYYADRDQLEAYILELADSVPIDASEWTQSKELYKFIDAWHEFAKYYAKYTDTVMGIEALSEYVYFVRLLRKIMCDNALDARTRQQAEDQLSALESAMDDIIKEAGSNLNN